jgi:predicted CXXCH cytochrome family protein
VLVEREAEVHFLLGSGTHGYSFLVGEDGYLFQSPISWYTKKQLWDLPPGYRERNSHFDRSITPQCLACHCNHVTVAGHSDSRFQEPIFAEGYAIGCERCHGPGELHVRRRQAKEVQDGDFDETIVNPAGLEPNLREAVCQQCHLQGTVRVLRRGREPLDFRPGLPMHLFWTVLIRPPDQASDPKAVGQVEQMYASRCFQGSGGKMGCTTCHDPHQQPTPEERTAFYRDRCLGCHEQASAAELVPKPKSGAKRVTAESRGCSLPLPVRLQEKTADNCAACHMPAQGTEIPHAAATDHRILRKPDIAEPPPSRPLLPRTSDVALVPFHRDDASSKDPETARDLAVGLMRSIAWQEAPPSVRTALLARVKPLLDQALERAPDDAEAWDARGFALVLQGRSADALAAYEKALDLNPGGELLLARAAWLAEQLGRDADALNYWQRAIAANPGQSNPHYQAARLLEKARNWTKALAECQETLRLNPFSIEGRMVQIRCLLADGNKNEAQAAFKILEALEPARGEDLRRWFAAQ